jgi:GNAT superfamily N-acetyltransferase
MSSLSVVEYDPRWRDDVLQLLSHLWGDDAVLNERLFSWKHEKNPYSEKPRLFLAFRDGRLVGMRGLFAGQWSCGEQAMTIYSFADTVVHPDLRNQGILSAITEQILGSPGSPAFPYLLTFSSSPATRRVALKRGAGELALDVVNCGLGRSGSSSETWPFSTAAWESTEPPARSMVELIQELPPTERFRHVRDEEYFRCKNHNPWASYRYYLLGRDPLNAYLVLKVVQRGKNNLAYLVDWEGKSADALRELLTYVKQRSEIDVLRTWSATLDPSRLQVLEDMGFQGGNKAPAHPQTLLVHPLDSVKGDGRGPALDALCRPENWDLRMWYADNH